jgi:hypothetical protein
MGEGAGARTVATQLQPQPPPQQPPPPPDCGVNDLLDPPAVAELNTESCMVAFLLAHLGQEISCCLLITSFSNSFLQSSQMYS